MVSVHVEVKRPLRSRSAESLGGSRAAETGASGVSRAPDTDEVSTFWVVCGGGARKLSMVSLPVVSSSRRKGVFFKINAPRAASEQEIR